jgi:hypothetical protein
VTSAGEKGTSTSNVTVQSRDEFDDAGGVVMGTTVVVVELVAGAGVWGGGVVCAGLVLLEMVSPLEATAHSELPRATYPALHLQALAETDPIGECDPAWQGVHALCNPADHVPAGHGVQS